MFAPAIGRFPSDTTPDTTFGPVSTGGPPDDIDWARVCVGAVGGATGPLPQVVATKAPHIPTAILAITRTRRVILSQVKVV